MDEITELLRDDLFPDSKDWRHGNIVDRVKYLIDITEAMKQEIEWYNDGTLVPVTAKIPNKPDMMCKIDKKPCLIDVGKKCFYNYDHARNVALDKNGCSMYIRRR